MPFRPILLALLAVALLTGGAGVAPAAVGGDSGSPKKSSARASHASASRSKKSGVAKRASGKKSDVARAASKKSSQSSKARAAAASSGVAKAGAAARKRAAQPSAAPAEQVVAAAPVAAPTFWERVFARRTGSTTAPTTMTASEDADGPALFSSAKKTAAQPAAQPRRPSLRNSDPDRITVEILKVRPGQPAAVAERPADNNGPIVITSTRNARVKLSARAVDAIGGDSAAATSLYDSRTAAANSGPTIMNWFGPKAEGQRYDSRMLHAARIAEGRARRHSVRRCWRYVKTALVDANVVDSYPQTAYAKQAGDELTSRYGFRRLAIRDPFKAPVGSVLVYGGRGPGHVEIRTNDGFVSDFESTTPSRRPLIGVFVKR